jgi:hypothetical protein
MVKDAKSGGTSEKDILVGSAVFEVKQFAKSGKEFLLGKDGSPGRTNALRYMRWLMDIVMKYNLVNDESDISEIVQRYVILDDVDKVEIGTEIRPAIIEDLYLMSKEVRKFIMSSKDDADELLTVGDEEYFIDSDEADKIAANKNVNVKIGPDAKDKRTMRILKEFAKHPYVKNPERLISDVHEIVNKYFLGLTGGLLIFSQIGDKVGFFVNGKSVSGTIVGDIKAVRITTGTWKCAPITGETEYIFINKQK